LFSREICGVKSLNCARFDDSAAAGAAAIAKIVVAIGLNLECWLDCWRKVDCKTPSRQSLITGLLLYPWRRIHNREIMAENLLKCKFFDK
jgi:hypothetical protein